MDQSVDMICTGTLRYTSAVHGSHKGTKIQYNTQAFSMKLKVDE